MKLEKREVYLCPNGGLESEKDRAVAWHLVHFLKVRGHDLTFSGALAIVKSAEAFTDLLSAAQEFRPTHRHVKTGGLYRVTESGRLEVTGDDAYELICYENEKGETFAQRADRFRDGRFQVLMEAVK